MAEEAKEDLSVSMNGEKEESEESGKSETPKACQEKKDVFEVPPLPAPGKADFKPPDLPAARPSSRSFKGPSKLVIKRPTGKPNLPQSKEKPAEPNDNEGGPSEKSSGLNKSEESASEVPDEAAFPKPVSKPIPYSEPRWSSCPSTTYRLEVIKGGKIIENINLTERPFTVFGRARNCHIELEHPSISRFHAVVQCRAAREDESEQEAEDEPCRDAFFVYDLGSTHGTTVNKEQLRPRTFYRLRLGHVVKFGGSTRMFVLVSGDGDQSLVEADAATEERRILEQRLKEAQRFGKIDDDEVSDKVEKDGGGIDWGFGEDAVEEENVMAERPDFEELAKLKGGKEAYFEKDPKKALKAFFDREGLDMEFDVKESGPGSKRTFTARVQLPIQSPSGAPVYGEASVVGKKRDAMLAAALDACRLLDSQGMLREHISSHKRKKHDWAENDYYDSDEDTFLDRTGTVEHKRLKRMQSNKKAAQKEVAETYDSLIAKLESVRKEKASHLESLQKDKAAAEQEDTADSLDAFMTNLGGRLDKNSRRKLHQSIALLTKEESRLEKLVALVAPTKLPELVKTDDAGEKSPVKDVQTECDDSRGDGFVSGETRVHPQAKAGHEETKSSGSKMVRSATHEVEEEEEEEMKEGGGQEKTNMSAKTLVSAPVEKSPSIEAGGRRYVGPALPIPEDVPESTKEDDDGGREEREANVGNEEDDSRRRKRKRERQRQREQKRARSGVSAVVASVRASKTDELDADPDIASWVPPQGQSGDGRTKLNEKFGY